MPDSLSDRDPLEFLADEFAARSRKGEAPSIFEYVANYPEYAEQIEQLFPAVAMMEQLRTEEDSRRDSVGRHPRCFEPPERIGDFDILREIGRGGMGVVYEAEQRSLARRVALKILPEHVLRGNQRLDRFQREARTAARLRHTAIVPVFGVGEQDGLHYYVMPLVRGVGLDEIIAALRAASTRSNGKRGSEASSEKGQQHLGGLIRSLIGKKFPAPYPEKHELPPWQSADRIVNSRWIEVARLGLQAARGLEYAHGQCTLHRDIKPGNLLVDDGGNACLADFGLARAIEPTRSGRDREREVVGTPHYMAPEQMRGLADVRSDIYSLGLTLYELLTLQPAACNRSTGFQEADQRAGVHGRLPPLRVTAPRAIDRTIPRDLEAIVLKCLAREPTRRYQSAADLEADLRRFVDDRPIRARRASRLERGWRWCRRNPALAAVSALAVSLLVAFAATACVGHMQIRTAYAETSEALAQAKATSGVALEVLEDLYLQLSPERVWIPTDSDLAGQGCACIGLRAARSGAPDQRDYTQVSPSEQTASLLENLLVFYDRLAEQVGEEPRIMLQSAIATRRVGDIRQRLGQTAHAEREYLKAIGKLDSLLESPSADARAYTELARSYNELGNVQAAQFEPIAAHEAHQKALKSLRASPEAQHPSEEHQYELARSYFFLASRQPEFPPTLRDRRAASSAHRPTPFLRAEKEYRGRAIALLEKLVRKNPGAADYRFLLALCYRPMKSIPAPVAHSQETDATWQARAPNKPSFRREDATDRILDTPITSGRERALDILEALKSQYPQVADYRYELATTYAWVHVGLFPWQGQSGIVPEAEQALHRALDEALWLVENNPTIPHFARGKALILAKLGAVCEQAGRREEGAEWFERALHAQSELVDRFGDLPSHDRVLREFFRFRLGLLYLHLDDSPSGNPSSRVAELLETCIETLTELRGRSELADDRLAVSSLQLAKYALGHVRHR